jgi:hypothetical protein
MGLFYSTGSITASLPLNQVFHALAALLAPNQSCRLSDSTRARYNAASRLVNGPGSGPG